MPRQLPWMNKGGSTQAKTKKAPTKKHTVPSDIDDDFFDGTILASSSKGKAQHEESEDALPDLPTEPSTPRTKSRRKDVFQRRRDDSSSPPPMADLERPAVEFMQHGVSKFDLRDDEWMMVEDEFLETAKLFTRHLHIAEYEKLKEAIEQKKKEADAPRPVVRGAKLSVDGVVREKVKAQEKKQMQAIRDVFASQEGGEDDGVSSRASFGNAALSFASTSRTMTSERWAGDSFTAKDPDSDDLDAPRPAKSSSTRKTAPLSTRYRPTASTSTSSRPTKSSASPVFAKPALPPPTTRPRPSKASRATPFDMLDDYTPRKLPSMPNPKPSPHPSSPTKPSTIPTTSPTKSSTAQPADLLDDWGASALSRETSDRLAKRKAEREREERQKERAKRKPVTADEIPTFLF